MFAVSPVDWASLRLRHSGPAQPGSGSSDSGSRSHRTLCYTEPGLSLNLPEPKILSDNLLAVCQVEDRPNLETSVTPPNFVINTLQGRWAEINLPK